MHLHLLDLQEEACNLHGAGCPAGVRTCIQTQRLRYKQTFYQNNTTMLINVVRNPSLPAALTRDMAESPRAGSQLGTLTSPKETVAIFGSELTTNLLWLQF